MLEIVLLLSLNARPRQAPLPPQAPAALSCRCGTNCPAGGNCVSCGCAEPKPEPPGKPGPGWHWDADGKFWWRYGGLEGHQAAPALTPTLAPPPALAVPPVTPYAILPRSFAPAATRSAASCST